jgi:hypothetical protein
MYPFYGAVAGLADPAAPGYGTLQGMFSPGRVYVPCPGWTGRVTVTTLRHAASPVVLQSTRALAWLLVPGDFVMPP